MSLLNNIKQFLKLNKIINVKELPSQGLFYKDDFELKIKQATVEDIIEYEYNYENDNVFLIINRIKKIVENNVILPNKYEFSDIKSIDIIFLFIEIVKFTNNTKIEVPYFNDISGKTQLIEFGPSNFNYYTSEEILNLDSEFKDKHYDDVTKEFVIDGYRYSVPSIGVENSLSSFLSSKMDPEDPDSEYSTYSYDFLYFLNNKTNLTFSEIENLIHIFNFDLESEDKKKVRSIVDKLSSFSRYSLKKDAQVVEVTTKINLERIWK